jgi:predicted nuclease of restriction endonuclease-like (RecB) superfamily
MAKKIMREGQEITSDLSVESANKVYQQALLYINNARQSVQKSIDSEMLYAYWQIGRDIVCEEQEGEHKAEYGKSLLKNLSGRLTTQYKRGFSVDSLERMRSFFLTYSVDNEISATALRKLAMPTLTPNLSWSHYIELVKIDRPEVRRFYELEASKNYWNVRELKRQIATFLYDRLAKSKNKDEILALVHKGQEINLPEDAIKEPMILEFLGVPEPYSLSETDLETAIISDLQKFLLELGKGFAFMGRQKRITFDNDHYYVDLVFYHAILKCYVLVDLKTHKLTHADLGQMQLYVNYFDAEIKQENDASTIGLILCTDKSDAMVKYMLGEKNKQIFASKYQFHLPTEKELEKELRREVKMLKNENDKKDE